MDYGMHSTLMSIFIYFIALKSSLFKCNRIFFFYLGRIRRVLISSGINELNISSKYRKRLEASINVSRRLMRMGVGYLKPLVLKKEHVWQTHVFLTFILDVRHYSPYLIDHRRRITIVERNPCNIYTFLGTEVNLWIFLNNIQGTLRWKSHVLTKMVEPLDLLSDLLLPCYITPFVIYMESNEL